MHGDGDGVMMTMIVMTMIMKIMIVKSHVDGTYDDKSIIGTVCVLWPSCLGKTETQVKASTNTCK